ncbi:Alba [Lotmaria passim]
MTSATEVPSNVVRVGLQKANTISAEQAKLRLHEGAGEITITALDLAISSAVIVAQMLRDQKMVEITKIYTRRGPLNAEEKKSRVCDQIEIKVVKTPEFDEIYAEQAKVRAERKAAREAEAAGAESGDAEESKE